MPPLLDPETESTTRSALDPRSLLDPSTTIGPEQAAHLAAHFETLPPRDLLAWALERWGRALTLVTSFQAEDMALLDLAWRVRTDFRVATLDTGRLHQETYDVMEAVRDRYGVEIEIFSPDTAAVEQLVREKGPNLFHRSVENRLACCRVRKVEPLGRALVGAPAWITGLRREQAPSRAGTPKVSVDAGDGPAAGSVKLAPIVDWSWQQLQDYLSRHDVPRHALYDQGYLSIGCVPCTRPVQAGEDPRAGRWWWEQGTKECGLHLGRQGTPR